jgi:hypothetical protein
LFAICRGTVAAGQRLVRAELDRLALSDGVHGMLVRDMPDFVRQDAGQSASLVISPSAPA